MRALAPVSTLRVDEGLSDEDVVRRVFAGETELYEIIMRRQLSDQTGGVLRDAYPFHVVRCDRVVESVLRRIRERRVS